MNDEPKMPPRVEAMLKAQTVAGIAITILAAVGCFDFIVIPLKYTIASWVLATAAAWGLSRLGIIAVTKISHHVYYKGDWIALMADSSEAQAYYHNERRKMTTHVWGDEDCQLVILQKNGKLGTFNDQPFYESIEVMGRDGYPYLFTYLGCQDPRLKNQKPISKDCIKYHPGIIYQVAGKLIKPINTVA